MCLPARQAPPWFEENMMNRNDEKDDEKGKKTKISSTHVPGRGHRAMYRYENMNMNMNIPIAISWRLFIDDSPIPLYQRRARRQKIDNFRILGNLTKIDPRVSPPRETARRPLLERGKKKAKKNRENEKIATFYVFIVLWTLAWMKKKSCLILQKKLSHWRRYRSVDTCLDEKEELSHFAKKIDSLAPVSYSGHLPG